MCSADKCIDEDDGCTFCTAFMCVHLHVATLLPSPNHSHTCPVRLWVSCSSCSMVAANAGLVGAILLLLSMSSSSLSSAFSSRNRCIAVLCCDSRCRAGFVDGALPCVPIPLLEHHELAAGCRRSLLHRRLICCNNKAHSFTLQASINVLPSATLTNARSIITVARGKTQSKWSIQTQTHLLRPTPPPGKMNWSSVVWHLGLDHAFPTTHAAAAVPCHDPLLCVGGAIYR